MMSVFTRNMDLFRTLDFGCDAEEDKKDSDSSGCDMSESFDTESDMSSLNISVGRRLNFGEENISYGDRATSPVGLLRPPLQVVPPFSPPYKRVRALRLFDSPATPKTILEKSSRVLPTISVNNSECRTPRSRLFTGEKPRAVPSAYSNHDNYRPIANVNPFTPSSKSLFDIIIKVYKKLFEIV